MGKTGMLAWHLATTPIPRRDTQICRLRRKVEQALNQALPIKTLRNVGYCFYATASIHE